jgi:hypothetical protein
MAHDVFISHSSDDKSVADAICATLEQEGIRCWIAPRDIRPGSEWSGALMEAIEHSRVLVLVLSRAANGSHDVIREVEGAIRLGVPVIPFRIEDVIPSGGLRYHLGTLHWLDAMTPPLRAHLRPLAETVRAILGAERSAPIVETRAVPRRRYLVAVGGAGLLIALAAIFLVARMSTQQAPPEPVPVAVADSAPPPVPSPGNPSTAGRQSSQRVESRTPATETRRAARSDGGTATAVPTKGAGPDRSMLQKVVGEYDNGMRIEVVTLESDGRLNYFIPGEPLDELQWERDWRFLRRNVPGVVIEFIRNRDGVVTALVGHVATHNLRVVVPRRFGEAPTAAALESLTGEYAVATALAVITLDEGKLYLTFPTDPNYPKVLLRFANGLHFATQGSSTYSVEFVRGPDGRISYLNMHTVTGDVILVRRSP